MRKKARYYHLALALSNAQYCQHMTRVMVVIECISGRFQDVMLQGQTKD